MTARALRISCLGSFLLHSFNRLELSSVRLLRRNLISVYLIIPCVVDLIRMLSTTCGRGREGPASKRVEGAVAVLRDSK